MQLGADQVFTPDQIDAEAEIASSSDGAVNRMCRRVITAHGVNGHSNHSNEVDPRPKAGLTIRR